MSLLNSMITHDLTMEPQEVDLSTLLSDLHAEDRLFRTTELFQY